MPIFTCRPANISDTMVYQMAKIGAEDGRPMVVLYFADADPSGWNMPVEVVAGSCRRSRSCTSLISSSRSIGPR